MPQTIERVPYMPEPAPNSVRWTLQQCSAMRECGILTSRYELIDGEIILKMGQKRSHALVIMQLTSWLIGLFGGAFVQFQLPLRVSGQDRDTSEPEPDAAVLVRPAGDFPDETPGVEFAALIIEVSDATLRFDRNTMAALYARNSVPEYWVIDVQGRKVYAYRNPTAEGYMETVVYTDREQVAPLAQRFSGTSQKVVETSIQPITTCSFIGCS